MRDALDDFDKYYPRWTKQNIVPSIVSIPAGNVSPSIAALPHEFQPISRNFERF
jgi:hypothetical protein